MSMSELSRKFELQPHQIIQWKKEFLENANGVFEKGKPDKGSDSEKEKDRLSKAIDELKVENDFFKDALRQFLEPTERK